MTFLQPTGLFGNDIKEVKRSFSIHRIATSRFAANELDKLIKCLASNLYERFKRDCCERLHQRYTVARFRIAFFYCAGVFIRHRRRRVTLKLAKDFSQSL